MLLVPLAAFAKPPATLFKSSEYGFRFVTTKECKKFFNVIQIGREAMEDNALARFDIKLSEQKELGSPPYVYFGYTVMTREQYDSISDEELPGKPKIIKKLRNRLLLTAYDPQYIPLESDLPQECFIKVRLLKTRKSP